MATCPACGKPVPSNEAHAYSGCHENCFTANSPYCQRVFGRRCPKAARPMKTFGNRRFKTKAGNDGRDFENLHLLEDKEQS